VEDSDDDNAEQTSECDDADAEDGGDDDDEVNSDAGAKYNGLRTSSDDDDDDDETQVKLASLPRFAGIEQNDWESHIVWDVEGNDDQQQPQEQQHHENEEDGEFQPSPMSIVFEKDDKPKPPYEPTSISTYHCDYATVVAMMCDLLAFTH
jgi:hypothetical protein